MRVMFGSHRPISKLARNVARPYAAYEEMTQGCPRRSEMRCFARMQRGGSGKGSIEGRFAFRNQCETWSDFSGDVLVPVPALHPLYTLGLLLRFQRFFTFAYSATYRTQ
jgi:hypothetical protein